MRARAMNLRWTNVSSSPLKAVVALALLGAVSACTVSAGGVYEGPPAGYVGDYYDPYCCGDGGWGGWGGWGRGHYLVGPPGRGPSGPHGGGGRPGGGRGAPSIPSGPRGGGGHPR